MSYEDPPTLQDVDDMFAEYNKDAYMTDDEVAQSQLRYSCTSDPSNHPTCCGCMLNTKMDALYESASDHWWEAMERAREAGEQKRQQDLAKFTALKAKREAERGQQPGKD